MPTPQINDWVTVELLANSVGQVVETVFAYKSNTSAIDGDDLAAFVYDWAAAIGPLFQDVISSEVRLVQAHAKTHFAEFPNVEAIYDFPPNYVGTRVGNTTPNNVALAVKLLTGIIGRSNRGRQFLFGFYENDLIQSYASSTLLINIGRVFARHLTGFDAEGVLYLPAVASRKELNIRTVLDFAIDLYLDSQRRRLVGRGT